MGMMDLKGSSDGLVYVICSHFFERSEENYEIPKSG
jgi:hypothetical protein